MGQHVRRLEATALLLGILASGRHPALGKDIPEARASLAAEVVGCGWIVYSARSSAGDWDLFACRPDGSSVTNLTRTPKYSEGYPVLAPDGRRMLYRRIDRTDTFDGNHHGAQGQAVLSGTDGSGARALGEAGQLPWACWSADALSLFALSSMGIERFDLSTLERTQVLDRQGFFQQIIAGPDGTSLSGVANGFDTAWSVACLDLASGKAQAVSIGDSCTPNWHPDGRSLVFSHRPPGQKSNGGYGWTQLWAGTPGGEDRRLLYADEGRHIYGGHVSPDGRFVIFTGNHVEDGDAGSRGARMSVIRLADTPMIVGPCPEARQHAPNAVDGPVLDIPDGWEPWWTASPPSPPPADTPSGAAGAPAAPANSATDAPATEVTARLRESPAGTIRNDPLYRYAAVLEYEVLRVHRGPAIGPVIHVAHYRPQFSRAKAADRFRPEVGGSLAAFRAGDVHRLVLAPDAEKWFVGGIINEYLDARDIFWAIRTDPAEAPR